MYLCCTGFVYQSYMGLTHSGHTGISLIYFTPLLYHSGGCLGCPKKQASQNEIKFKKPAKAIKKPFIQFWLGSSNPNRSDELKVDHTQLYCFFSNPRFPIVGIFVEISWFLHFVLRFLTCCTTWQFFHYFQNKAQFPLQ